MASPELVSITPENETEGVPLLQSIIANFSVAIDKDSIQGGAFVVATTAKNVISQNSAFLPFPDPDTERNTLLESPEFTGVLTGVFTFSTDYKTVTFNPTFPLDESTLYTILISGELLSRTILDIVPAYSNSGNGVIEADGPYTGEIDDTFNIQIVDTGGLRVGTFIWWKTSDPTAVSDAITLDRAITLEDGVILRFAVGTYNADDSWSFEVLPGDSMGTIYSARFTSSQGGLTEVPVEEKSVEVVQSGLEGSRRITSTPDSSSTFSVTSVSPAGNSYNLPINTKNILITFNKEIDEETVTLENIKGFIKNLPSVFNARTIVKPIAITSVELVDATSIMVSF